MPTSERVEYLCRFGTLCIGCQPLAARVRPTPPASGIRAGQAACHFRTTTSGPVWATPTSGFVGRRRRIQPVLKARSQSPAGRPPGLRFPGSAPLFQPRYALHMMRHRPRVLDRLIKESRRPTGQSVPQGAIASSLQSATSARIAPPQVKVALHQMRNALHVGSHRNLVQRSRAQTSAGNSRATHSVWLVIGNRSKARSSRNV